MSDRPTLAAILRLPARDAHEIMDALEALVSTPERRGLPLAELPEPARMILVFREVWSALHSAGMLYVIDWTIGEWIHDVVKWARKIGAERTASYFNEAAALFPRRRVPKDREERVRIFTEADPEGERVEALDRQYREKVLKEIPSKLKTYLRENREAVQRALASAARRPAGSHADDVVPYQRQNGDDIEWRVAFSRQYEALTEKERKKEGFPREVVAIGDVIELKGDEGYCYAHATHPHPFWRRFGPVCRVLPGVFRKSLSTDELHVLVQEPELFFHVVKVNDGIAERSARIVAHVEGPWLQQPFPTFRYDFGKTRDGRWAWKRWLGGETGDGPAMVEPLTPEQRAIFPFEPEEPEYVVGRVAEGWRPENEVYNRDLYRPPGRPPG